MAARPNEDLEQILEACETIQNLTAISDLLGAGLDTDSLTVCMRLLERGADPATLAQLVLDVKKEVNALEEKEQKAMKNK